MIVVASQPGRLGNLLVVYASLLAWAFEHKRKITNPAFHRYSHYFTGTHSSAAFLNKGLYKVSYLCARIIDRFRLSNPLIGSKHLDWQDKIDLDTGPDALPQVPLYFIQGWQYRARNLVPKHSSRLRSIFAPAPPYAAQLDKIWKNAVQPGHHIIGVHVRRGDYKTFENGSYFFEPQTYELLMNKMMALLGTEQVSFFVCSDDPAILPHFSKWKNIIRAPGHELLDMYGLARCHYIMGPPSTYSIWASFYGKVPLYMVHDPKREFTLNDFLVQETF